MNGNEIPETVIPDAGVTGTVGGPTRLVKLLECNCGDCVHWEIGQDGENYFILCRTCGQEFPMTTVIMDPHDKISWQPHHR